nr:O-antigen ligase family protein [uncultured Desulfobacter sp.]
MKKGLFIIIILSLTIGMLFPGWLSFGYGLNPTNITIYVAILILLITDVYTGRMKQIKIPNLKILIFICTYVGIDILLRNVSHLPIPIGFSFVEQLQIYKKFVFDPAIIFCISFFLINKSKERDGYLAIMIVTFSTLFIGAIILVKLNMVIIHGDQDPTKRFSSLTGNPNQDSYLLCILLPYAYYLFKKSKIIIFKAFLGAIMLSSSVIVVLSGSRGGLLSLLLIFGLIIVKIKDYKLLLLGIILFPIVLYSLWDNPMVKSTVERITIAGDAGAALQGNMSAGRINIWLALLDVYSSKLSNAVIGTGFGTAEYEGLRAPPHNMYLKILVENGIVGLFIWFIFIAKFIFSVLTLKTSKKDTFKTVFLISSLVILLGWCFTTMAIIIKVIALIFGLSLSCLNFTNKSIETES